MKWDPPAHASRAINELRFLFHIHTTLLPPATTRLQSLSSTTSDPVRIKEKKRLQKDIDISRSHMAGNTEMGETLKRDTCLIDSVNRDDLLAERISEEKTPCFPSSSSCIYRVPSKFLSVNKEVYEPRVISIGPHHRSKETLGATDKYKVLYLHSFVSRNPQTNLSDYVKAIREIETEARESYAEVIDLSSDEFVRMMVLDGCFILELLMKYQVEESNMESKDCLFNATWKIPSLRRDMVLLENQIPFLVLDCLYNLSQSPKKATPLVKLVLDFFDPILPTIQEVNQYRHIVAKHLLDFLRSYLVDQFKPIDFGDHQFWEYTTCATSLEEAGVKLQRKDSGKCLLDITFTKDGKVQIPPFSFGQSWNVLFPNLIALEQCRRDYPDMITSYVILVNKLINSQEDVKLLSDKGIIDCLFVKEEKVPQIMDKLCQEVVVDNFYYDGLCNRVNAFRRTHKNKWRSTSRLNRSNTSWVVISYGAAIILLVFILASTLFHNPYFPGRSS